MQRAVRRCLIAHGGVITTSQAINWAYGQRIEMNGEIRNNGFNYTVRNALEALGAKRIERTTRGTGRPFLWEWNDADDIRKPQRVAPAHAHVDDWRNHGADHGDRHK